MLYVMGYFARSCDRLCDRYTATAIRPLPHGHRYTVTAIRPSPHSHRHTATATRPLPHGHRHTVTAIRPSHPWPGYVPGYILGYVPGYVISYMPGCNGTFNHGNLPGPLALGHSWRSLAFWHPRPFFSFGP